MARGFKCPTCGHLQGTYEKGAYRCKVAECSSVWWGPFDKPSAGKPRKGYKCYQCRQQTVHPVAEMDDVSVWRCSTCGATILEHGS